jgi:RNA:NAD 2'-phosphotransferase (TPT1/KptA family)
MMEARVSTVPVPVRVRVAYPGTGTCTRRYVRNAPPQVRFFLKNGIEPANRSHIHTTTSKIIPRNTW